MIRQFGGKFTKIVEQITKYEGLEAPSIDIDVQKPYSVIAHGETQGTDSFSLSAQGTFVRKSATLKLLGYFDRLRAVRDAKKNARKQNGITAKDAEEINFAISNYNGKVGLYNQVDGGQIISEISREVVEIEKIDNKDLEELLSD